MTDSIIETAQWRKGKTPIVRKYVDEHGKLFDAIAGRGFLRLPGYAYDAENRLELTTKESLSTLNYKILTDTVERELKQIGITYTSAFKTATIAWELEKQSLMAVWDTEFILLKQDMTAKEEVLNRLAITIDQRSIDLLEAKTVIELEAEGYKKELAELDGTVAPYEVQLATAKLTTAQKKLDLIPILQEILVKEQLLLVQEQNKAAAYTTYMAAEQLIGDKKQTLASSINVLASKTDNYAAKISSDLIPKETLIAAEKVAQSEAAVTKAGHQVEELLTEIETEEKKSDLMDHKRALQILTFNNEQSLVTTGLDLDDTYHDAEKTQFTELHGKETTVETDITVNKRLIHDASTHSKVTSAHTLSGAEQALHHDLNDAEIDEITRKALADAAVNIAAKLTHLIG